VDSMTITRSTVLASTDATQLTFERCRSEAKEAVEAMLARGISPAEAVRLARTRILAAQRARVIHQAELEATRPAFAAAG
jgi:uncharacterized protein YoaH (UPF0181 family)